MHVHNIIHSEWDEKSLVAVNKNKTRSADQRKFFKGT